MTVFTLASDRTIALSQLWILWWKRIIWWMWWCWWPNTGDWCAVLHLLTSMMYSKLMLPRPATISQHRYRSGQFPSSCEVVTSWPVPRLAPAKL